MSEEFKNEDTSTENTPKEKKPVCILSIIAFVLSLGGAGMYVYIVGCKMGMLRFTLGILGIASIFLSIAAKKVRITWNKSGKGFEIAAIVLGGFSFYFWIFLMPQVSMFVGYLGWIVGGLIYKFIERENA